MSPLLAISTSSPTASVAVVGTVSLARQAPGGETASQWLLPAISELLAEAGVALGDCAIAFDQGPGAFTGVRLGAAIAQGLAFGLAREALPVSSLQALAWPLLQAQPGASVLALIDARMGEVYAGRIALDGNGLPIDLVPPCLLAPGELPVPTQRPLLVAGSALAAHAGRLPPALAKAAAHWDPEALPTATAVAGIAGRRLAAGIAPGPPWPLYLRDKVAMTVAERAARLP